MQERVRICDIAEELGLSTATVSNVIHGKTNKVSDETVAVLRPNSSAMSQIRTRSCI